MKRFLVVALLAPGAIAHADATRYVQTDVMIGGAAPVVGPNLLGAVEGGYRFTPELWVHAALAAGPASDDQGKGKDLQARAGVETRSCGESGTACFVVGADLGVQRGTWTNSAAMQSEHLTALVFVPRAGVDLGGKNLRGRLGLELDEAIVGQRDSSSAATTSATGTIGFELAAGVAYQW